MNQSDHNEYLQSCALKIPLPQPNYKSYHPIFCSGLFWIVLDYDLLVFCIFIFIFFNCKKGTFILIFYC